MTTLKQSIPRLNQLAVLHDLRLWNPKHFKLAVKLMNQNTKI